jgi:uncharacterized protein (TIGR02118 family)
MVAKVFALYKMPADTAAFDRYCRDVHVPIAKEVPGRYEVSRGIVGMLGGPSPYHLIAVLTFDSAAAIQAALTSPEGQVTAADIGNFATGGVEIHFADMEEI